MDVHMFRYICVVSGLFCMAQFLIRRLAVAETQRGRCWISFDGIALHTAICLSHMLICSHFLSFVPFSSYLLIVSRLWWHSFRVLTIIYSFYIELMIENLKPIWIVLKLMIIFSSYGISSIKLMSLNNYFIKFMFYST